MPNKAQITVLGTDYDNWAVMYACHKKLRLVKNEWVWILSRTPTLSDEHRDEAYKAIKKAIRKFDFDRLVPVE